MKIFLILTGLKHLVRKKNQSRLRKYWAMKKTLWFEINKKELEELTREIYNNQDKNDFKIIINRRPYDLKNAKKIWRKVTIHKSTKSDTKNLYNELIQKDNDALEKEKNYAEREEVDGIIKYNVLNILKNVSSIFSGAYLDYKNVPKEAMFERSIEERINLRRGRLDKIERKEQNMNNELFKAYFTDYQSPSNMYKKLSETKGAVNEVRVDSVKKTVLSKLQRVIKNAPKDDVFKI